MHGNKIETWMFREKGEIFTLIITVIVVVAVAIYFVNISLWWALVAIFFGFLYIKLQQSQLIGNALEVNENQLPEIYEVFIKHKELLGIKNANLFITQDPSPNAFTIGFPTASIIITSALVENFSFDELEFTIAHELGHVKAGHNIILTFIYPLGNGVPAASLIFSFWRRKAEYSSDKCALILTKKIDSGVSSLLKLSIGLNIGRKVAMESYRNQLVNSKNTMVSFSEILSDHPLTTNRINALVIFWRKNFIYK